DAGIDIGHAAIFLLPVATAFMDVRAHEAGTQHRYADTERIKLLRPAFAHADHRVFRGGVGLEGGPAHLPRQRRGVDEVPAFAVAFDERQETFHTVDDALQVDVDDPVPIDRPHRSDLAADGDTGIVADDMDLPERRNRGQRRALHAFAFRHVA